MHISLPESVEARLKRVQPVMKALAIGGVKSCLVGSLAGQCYQVPRDGSDVDLLIVDEPENRRRLRDALLELDQLSGGGIVPWEIEPGSSFPYAGLPIHWHFAPQLPPTDEISSPRPDGVYARLLTFDAFVESRRTSAKEHDRAEALWMEGRLAEQMKRFARHGKKENEHLFWPEGGGPLGRRIGELLTARLGFVTTERLPWRQEKGYWFLEADGAPFLLMWLGAGVSLGPSSKDVPRDLWKLQRERVEGYFSNLPSPRE